MGRRTLTAREVEDLRNARERATATRSRAAAEIATAAVNEPDDAVARALMRLSARILVTTSADWNPRASAVEVDSWDMPTDWEMAG